VHLHAAFVPPAPLITELVALVRADEHDRMIALFFATKVWVLKEGVVLPA